METKICSKCKIEKEITCFHKCSNSKDGHKSICKECIKIDNRKYVESNKDIIKEKSKILRLKNKKLYSEHKKIYYIKNKRIILDKNKKWRDNNKEIKKEINKKYYFLNKDKFSEKKKKYRENNKEKLYEQTKKWINENYDYYLQQKRERNRSEIGLKIKREWYHKNKEKNKHIIAWRTVLNNSLKRFGTKKEGSTIELLGYSATDLKENMISKFKDGMSWDNYGEWHIDHIKPVSKFEKNEKQSVVNSLDNLQPLWKDENLKKYNKIIN